MEAAEREARAEEVIGALNDTCLSFAQERVFATVVDPLIVEGEVTSEMFNSSDEVDVIILPGTVQVDAEFEQFVYVEGKKNWGIHAVLGEVAVIKSSVITLPKRQKFDAMLSPAGRLQRIMRAA